MWPLHMPFSATSWGILYLLLIYVAALLQFDVTFPALPCSLVAVDTMDVSGEQHYDIVCTTVFISFLIILYIFWSVLKSASQALYHIIFYLRFQTICFAETWHNKEKNW